MSILKPKSPENQIITHFGLKSQNYQSLLKILREKAKKLNTDYSEAFDRWSQYFKDIYGKQLTEELFLKQSYYNLVLRFFLSWKLDNSNLSISDFDKIFLLEKKLYDWVDFSNEDLIKIFSKPESFEFKELDLFNQFYQEFFGSKTRHLTGEFYTFPNLASKMVNETYKLGDNVLDPSCGSGIFLIEVLKIIINSNKEYPLKIKAINNIYGFDINPLALLTCKTNFLLILLDHIKPSELLNFELNLLLVDSLFPNASLKRLKNSFDLLIGNPPWLTYKDLEDKAYQKKIRELAEELGIKPSSQYTTHIELASIFFYAIPIYFSKINGTIFFVITKSILNGDHCFKFRAFKIFEDLEIWDFPNEYFFNVNHVCLKASFTNRKTPITEKYPIKTKLFNESIELQEELLYDSIEIKRSGARIILPSDKVKKLQEPIESRYKKLFWQGATLVPRSLIFFEIGEKHKDTITIFPDKDVLSRAKKNWKLPFKKTSIEKTFHYLTFLNKDLVPFCIKQYRNVFLPINQEFKFEIKLLKKNPLSFNFYKKQNQTYKDHKKKTSSINSLFDNLNYWNKLTKQVQNHRFIVVYNASGSSLKSAVIENTEKNIIIGSENYYFSSHIQYEAYYLSSVLNSTILSKNVKLIKSSRHIHKRPFIFPIPLYDDKNPIHRNLATKGKKYHTVVRDLVSNNPKINSEKVRMFIHQKLVKLDSLVNQILFE